MDPHGLFEAVWTLFATMVELYIFFHDTLSNKIIKQMLDIL